MFIVCLSENRNLIWLTTISQLLILCLEKYLTTICSTHGWSDESVIITTKSTNFHSGKLSRCTLLYWFSIAAITHCRKCSGLRKKKKKEFWMLEVWHGSHWTQIKKLAGLRSFLEAQENQFPLPFQLLEASYLLGSGPLPSSHLATLHLSIPTSTVTSVLD